MGCRGEIIKKFDKYTKREIEDMAKQLNRIRNRRVSKDELAGDLKSISGLSNEDAFKQINQIAAEVNRFYKKQKINKLKGIVKLNNILEQSRQAKRAFDGVESVLTGSQGSKTTFFGKLETFLGQGKSAAAQQDVIRTDMFNRLNREMTEGHEGIWDAIGDEAFDKDVFLEMAEVETKGGNVGLTGNKDALHMAKVFAKFYEEMRLKLNDAGADIPKMAAYNGSQMHSPSRVRGRVFFRKSEKGQIKSKEIKARWIEDQLSWLDHEKTFGDDVDVDNFLSNVYDNITTGLHGVIEGQATDIPNNAATASSRFNRPRVLIYKDAESAFANNSKYGEKGAVSGLIDGLQKRAEALGLMEKMGPNPEKNFNRLMAQMAAETKGDKGGPPLVEAQQQGLRNRFAAVSGKDRIIQNPTLATISSNLRALNNMTSLGLATITSANDIVMGASNAQFNGIGFLDAYAGILKRIVKLKLSEGEKKIAMSILHAGIDHAKAAVHRNSAGDFKPGVMSSLQETFFKWNRLQWWTDFGKEINTVMLSNHVGNMMDNGFDDLGLNFKETLKAYGITSKEWGVMRKGKSVLEDGRSYFTPDSLDNIADDALQGVSRKELKDALHGMFLQEADVSVPTPGAKERAIIRQGLQAGSPYGVAVELFAQFKMFPLTIMTKVWPRLRQQNVFSGAVQMMLLGTLMGYASLGVKDLLKGLTPRSPKKLSTWTDAMLNGGSLSVAGDFLFQDFNIYGRGPISTLGGPTVGTLEDVLKIYSSVARGEGKIAGAKVFRSLIKNTPFFNLWGAQGVRDYLFMHSLNETLNPGYLDRKFKNLKERRGQMPLLSKSRNKPRKLSNLLN